MHSQSSRTSTTLQKRSTERVGLGLRGVDTDLGGRGSCRAFLVPTKLVEDALVRPIVGVFYQAMTNRIFSDIYPFVLIAFPRSKARVPMICLPLGVFQRDAFL